MIDVSIVIVNFNTKELLNKCIYSIIDKTFNLQYEIIIVDNASTDGSQIFIKENYPQIKLIAADTNLGFGIANNLGVKSASGEFVFFLNSDTVFIENSVKIMYDFFTAHEYELSLGALGAVLVDENLRTNGFGSHFPTCSDWNQANLNKIPLINFFINLPKKHSYSIEQPYFEIDYVIGADLLMRKSIFEQLEGFSKDFFMYYEESDLQKRISNLRLSRYIITTTKIIHLEDGSGKAIKKYSNKKRTIVHKSRNTYLKKNDSQNFTNFVIIDFIVLCLNFLNLKYTLKENLNYFKEIVKTY